MEPRTLLDLPGTTHLTEGPDPKMRSAMIPKGAAMGRALLEGVRRVHVISHQVPDSLLSEVFTNEGAGTLVVPDLAQLGQELSGVGR